MALDFVAIGDIVTDDFIELEDAHIEEHNRTGEKQLCMNFGDKIPFKGSVVIPAVGNSPNASVSAHRLGLTSALVTDLGNDNHGTACLEQLKEEGVATDFVRVHDGTQSNYHYVLRFRAERTILVKHYEYEYVMPEFSEPPRYVYLSSLAENSLPYHNALADYFEKTPESKLAFQPGTFQIKLGKEKLKRLYAHAELFFCNKEEAQRILENTSDTIQELLKGMHALGPRITVITDGPRGAYVYDGNEIWHGPMYPDPAPPVDRTGAGDSFSSTFTAALALGNDIPTALSWGPVNSMSVVQYIGAQEGLLTREKLEEYLASAPSDYVPRRL